MGFLDHSHLFVYILCFGGACALWGNIIVYFPDAPGLGGGQGGLFATLKGKRGERCITEVWLWEGIL